MDKLTWREFREKMWQFNEEHGVTAKGIGPTIYGVVVMTADSFNKPYTETERSYRCSNHNKAFIANQCSNSIFADCLDGTDDGVRLDWYIPTDWKVDYCYFEEEKVDG